MAEFSIDLSIAWLLVIGLAIMMYVILDGFDLGLGILFPFAKTSHDRDVMMASIAPVWDGNETWLILGGAGLFAAFNKAYAMVLPALYFPLVLFLVALILRGIAFEFRFKSEKRQWLWGTSFSLGSFLATFIQGVVVGCFVEGFPPMTDGHFSGEFLWWLTPFTFMTGVALLVGYALLGACWLVYKSEGALQIWSRKLAEKLLAGLFFFFVVVSIWTPLTHEAISARWFQWPNILYLAPVPFYSALLAVILWVSLRKKGEVLPFLCCVGLFFLGFSGLLISLWPYIVPRQLTIWQAASAPTSQLFSLIGVLFLLPLIIAYTAHSYWVFRGKAEAHAHYH